MNYLPGDPRETLPGEEEQPEVTRQVHTVYLVKPVFVTVTVRTNSDVYTQEEVVEAAKRALETEQVRRQSERLLPDGRRPQPHEEVRVRLAHRYPLARYSTSLVTHRPHPDAYNIEVVEGSVEWPLVKVDCWDDEQTETALVETTWSDGTVVLGDL
tara:strand:+ start:53 stop:520 length:468 start_codon:yes stop_codon:yes gene_type:complete